MKNRYFGDVNDYWKFGLLRDLASAGLSVGVCWLLTPDGKSRDGERRAYLKKPRRWESADPALFALMQKVNAPGVERDVRLAETLEFIPGARYFHEMLTRDGRAAYFEAAHERLHDCDVVFFDPDNGIEIATVGPGRQESVKYVFRNELESTYARGHSVLVYQHLRQVNRSTRMSAIVERLGQDLKAPRIDIVGPASLAFVVVHQPTHTAALSQAIEARSGRWADVPDGAGAMEGRLSAS